MPGIRPVGGICGANVTGADGEALGSITELMLDIDTGRITYAVLAYGGVLGVGEKLFALPWAGVEIDPASGEVRVGVTRDQLEKLPGFDKDAWPTGPDPAFDHLNATEAA